LPGGTCCVQLMSGANVLFRACGISSVAMSFVDYRAAGPYGKALLGIPITVRQSLFARAGEELAQASLPGRELFRCKVQ